MARRSGQVIGVVMAGAALLAAAAVPAAAQVAPVRQVTFDEAVQQALERNPSIAQAATAIARADALVAQARSLTMPNVSAGFTNVTIDGARGFEGGVTQPQNQTAFSANASMPVLAASQWAAVDQARDQVEVATRSTEEVRQQVAVAAAEAYLAIITARRQVDVDERALETARAHLAYAERRLEGGAGSRLNMLRAAQVVSSDQARLEATRLLLMRAQEALGVMLAENGPVDAAGDPVFEDPGPVDESSWMNQRRDVLFEQSVRRAAERAVRDSWKDWLPTATASFDPQYLTPSGLFQPSNTWRLSFVINQPIFEGGERRAAERLRQANLEASSFTISLVEIQARSEVRLARAAIAQTTAALQAARLAAEQANEVLRITTAAFEFGATTNIEVIDAQRSARDTEVIAALAEDAVRRAQLDLLVAIGRFPR